MPELMMQPDLSAVTANGGVRGAALARWQENGWPGPRAEAWRYTSLERLSDVDLAPATGLAGGLAGPGAAAAAGINAHVIRFENGVVDPAGMLSLPGGVSVAALAGDEAAMARLADLLRQGLKPPPPQRKATRPGRAAVKRRLEAKKKRGDLKRQRRNRPTLDE